MMYLAFDTETTGLPIDPSSSNYFDTLNWPRAYQIGAILFDEMGMELGRMNKFIKPDGWVIPVVDEFRRSMGERDFHAEQGIYTELLEREGIPLADALDEFIALAERADAYVCHNALFDRPVMTCEFYRAQKVAKGWIKKPQYCTKELMTPVCVIPGWGNLKGYKWPTLQEAHVKLFGREFDGAHDALADVQATVDVFLEIQWMVE